MTNKEKIARYLDKVPEGTLVTTHRIARCSCPSEYLNYQYVYNVITALGAWESVPCWSNDGNVAWKRRII